VGPIAVGQLGPLTHLDTLTEGLESPARIAVTPAELLVTDPQADAIVRFDHGGGYVGSWLEPAGPIGVAVHPDGRIFVSRRDDGQVGVYDAAFTFLRLLGDTDPLVDFVMPTDLTVDPTSGRIYVVDGGGDQIYGFASDESLAARFGARGGLTGEFKYPSAIAVDALHNRLIVADQDNFRVQVFSDAGLFLFKFGYRIKFAATGVEGWVARPTGVAVDGAGNIYLTDAVMSTLRVFDPTGRELGKVVEFGTGPGALYTPCDVAVDGSGRILVANSTGGGVERYAAPSKRTTAEAIGTAYGGTNVSFLARVLRSADPLLRFLSRNGRSKALRDIPGHDPPHMTDDVLCQRCHDFDDQPGGHIGLVSGQTVVCLSCHTGGSQAPAALFHPTANLGVSHAWGVDAVSETFGSEGPPPNSEMALYLDNGQIKCATCHNAHTDETAAPYLRAAATALCQLCHREHVIHTPSGGWMPTCIECHAAHDPFARNLSLIRGSVHNLTLGVDKPVVFTAASGPNSFEDGDPAANDGICQVCHTSTNYHTHDGSGTPHQDGTACTSCHPHESGFMPAGGDCVGCHSSAQDTPGAGPPGGRRAVVGEFPESDAHAHYGTELTSDACTVCHDQATHMGGNVVLIDPDSGALYTFVYPEDLTFDPDLSDFCASCHDADGATRLGSPMDPFGTGEPAPDVASRFQGTLQWDEWYGDTCFGEEGTLRQVNSHHDISDADQAFSGAKLECLSCHGAHTSGSTQPVVDPFSGAAPAPWTGSMNAFCLECHWGGFGPADPGFPSGVVGPTVPLRGLDNCDYYWEPWWVQYSWTHAAHGLDSKRGWAGYSGAPGAEVECLACHDAHGSYSPTNTAGNPYAIRDFVDGTPYIDDGVRPGAQWSGPPWDTTGTPAEVVVTIDGIDLSWGSLCVTCHGDWQGAYDFHAFCTGCQSCHGHGQAWQNNDWGSGPRHDTLCPSNNHCSDPLPLTLDPTTFDVTVLGDTTLADEDNKPFCGSAEPTQTLWYSVAGTGNTLTATTCSAGTTFDTVMQVFCDGCDTPVCVTSSDDDASCGLSGVRSTVSWCSDANQTYWIQLGGSGGASGVVELYNSDDQAACGPPDGCPAVPPAAADGSGLTGDNKTAEPGRTAPHPNTGGPTPLHGTVTGR
jgi:predicted CXXCH cytochrome family protein